MLRRKRFWILVIALVSVLTFAGYDLAQLQNGFEQPSEAVVQEANPNGTVFDEVVSIDSYESMTILVEEGISVDVHMRERPEAKANILMVHGAGGGAWAWEPFFDIFPDQYNLYALSWRGHFTSSSVSDANSEDYVRDQAAVIDTLMQRNRLPIHVIAHSYGGATSVMLEAEQSGKIRSMHLIAPVVPLQFSGVQKQLVPVIVGPIIRNSTSSPENGPFRGMFLSEAQRDYYFETYASKDFSAEKPGLIAVDGLSQAWYDQLDEAYETVGESALPVWMLIARYDNVVVPDNQLIQVSEWDFGSLILESGHYIQLDVERKSAAEFIIANLETVNE